MDDREQRGLVIAATKPIRQRGVNWYVPSATGNGTYKVEPEPDRPIGEWLCECPDFQLRAKPCKHVHAVTFTVQRETVTVTDDVVITETETTSVRLTYGQDWVSYNTAQCAEGDLFGPMLKDFCATIAQPQQKGPGRPRDAAVGHDGQLCGPGYSGLSAIRFDSEVREPHGKA